MTIEELIANCRVYSLQPLYGNTLAMAASLLLARITDLERRFAAVEGWCKKKQSDEDGGNGPCVPVAAMQATPATGTLRDLAAKWKKRSADNYGQGHWAEAHDHCASELEVCIASMEPTDEEIADQLVGCSNEVVKYAFRYGVRWMLARIKGETK